MESGIGVCCQLNRLSYCSQALSERAFFWDDLIVDSDGESSDAPLGFLWQLKSRVRGKKANKSDDDGDDDDDDDIKGGTKNQKARKKRGIISDSDSDLEEIPPQKKSHSSASSTTKTSAATKTSKTSKTSKVVAISDSDEDSSSSDMKKGKTKSASGKVPNGHARLPKSSPKNKPSEPRALSRSPRRGDKPQPAPAAATASRRHVEEKKLSPVKLVPTSVSEYFGTTSVQRSNRTLVAKRKAGSDSTDESFSPSEPTSAQDDVSKLEKQLHEDEEFARTLAMLDEEEVAPQHKKARVESLARSSKTPEKQPALRKRSPAKPTKAAPPPLVKFEPRVAPKRSPFKAAPLSAVKLSPVKKEIDRSPSLKGTAMGSPARTGSTETSPKSEKGLEDSEKKRQNVAAYRHYLSRDGPRALGSKEIPQGGENCLEGLTFVITGVLESLEREEARSLVERYGGKVTGNVSKRTDYLVVGRDPGNSKLDKAESCRVKQVDEDGLLELIRTRPGKKSKYTIAAETEAAKAKFAAKTFPSQPTKLSPDKLTKTSPEKPTKTSPDKPTSTSPDKPTKEAGGTDRTSTVTRKQLFSAVEQQRRTERTETGWAGRVTGRGPSAETRSPRKGSGPEVGGDSLLWVDRYRPQSLKNIIGQQGDQSPANKLLRWLRAWHSNHGGGSGGGRKAAPSVGEEYIRAFQGALDLRWFASRG